MPTIAALATLLSFLAAPSPYVDRFAQLPDRRWPGAEWYATRVQDWRVHEGRLECVEDRAALSFRTTHLLTRRIGVDGDVTLRVRVQPTDGAALGHGAAAGFLIGAGGDDVDPRLTAMIQQAPAEGGGWLAVVDGAGTLRLLDFSRGDAESGAWSISSRPGIDDLPALATDPARAAWKDGEPLDLVLTITDDVLRLGTADGASATIVRLTPRDRRALDGGIALVSHRAKVAFSHVEVDGALATPHRAWGPVLGVQYTIDRDDEGRETLRLTAQLPVLGPHDERRAELEVRDADGEGAWRSVARGTLVEDGSYTIPFVVPDRASPTDVPFRVRYAGTTYDGVLRAPPPSDRATVVASLSCVKNYTGGLKWNHDGLWFPHADLVDRVASHDPDLLFFAGDQIYEGDISGPDRRTPEINLLDYHTKWQRFLWAFGPLTRRAPAVTIPDDHDVYHGNLWGAGGVRARARDGVTAQDAGGYKLPAAVVNAIHRTQTSHLPPRRIPGPVGQGIEPYTTRLVVGGLDCAILSDRMFKDSATVVVPAGDVQNGFFRTDGFDPRRADVPGARLLGSSQEAFLSRWADERPLGAWVKLVLSQSPFTTVHTLPHPARTDAVVPSLTIPAAGDYPENDVAVLDADSNGWPQSARNRALRIMRRANALHLAGDQHLGTVVRYGIDAYGDGTIAFTSPAIGNTWPRRWMPATPGENRRDGDPRYTGDFRDGFANRITVFAAANPRRWGETPAALFDRSPGYAIVRLDARTRHVVLEAWPRFADPTDDTEQFPGWPITFRVDEDRWVRVE